jgi:hypothetical protein
MVDIDTFLTTELVASFPWRRSVSPWRLGKLQLRMRGVRSEKGMALRSGCRTEMWVIAAFFARGRRGCPGRACMRFLLILQEVRRI